MTEFKPRVGALRYKSANGDTCSKNPGSDGFDSFMGIANEWWNGESWQPHKAGDIVVHMSPSYPPGCQHEWPRDEVQDSDCCTKCGMSFTRYIFMEMP